MLSPSEVAKLLRFCLDVTFLEHKICFFYKQTFGTAMESADSVTVTNLVMEDVQERAIASYYSFGRDTRG